MGALPRLVWLLLALARPVASQAAATSVPLLGTDDLRPGMSAVVRTVFEGQRVDTFSAEIVGVLHGGRAEG
ncbi:MAG TPA: hypothetical protein VLV15_08715, partial [Dongiaceae bacterium]|nr:hypothetical protein [Dongiaceae bacterium]